MNWFVNLKIKRKLLCMILLAAIFMGAIAVTGYYYLINMESYTTTMYNNKLIPVKQINEIQTAIRNVEARGLELMLIGNSDETKKKQIIDLVQRATDRDNQLLAGYEKLPLDNYEIGHMKNLRTELVQYRTARTKSLDMAGQGMGVNAYKYYMANSAPHLDKAITILQQLADYDANMAKQYMNRVQQSVLTAKIIITAIFVLALLIFIIISMMIAKMIVRPVQKLETLMFDAGNGNLTVEGKVASKDELGHLTASFNSMISGQKDMIAVVHKAAHEIAAASEETSASTEETSSAVQEIAKCMEDVVKEAEEGNHAVVDVSIVLLELSSLIQIAKTKGTSAERNSTNTLDAASRGQETVEQTIHSMETIRTKTYETEEWMNRLDQYSQQIETITTTITNIAEQTNLLALNAAIEAARAGEHGKGFSVVADEVRKLAEQSSKGATEVRELLQKVLESTSAAVHSTQQSRIVVEKGTTAVNEAGQALEQIVTAVQSTVEDIRDIVKVTNDEVASSEKIVSLIHSVASVVEKTAASAQEVAASTEEISSSIETVAATTQQTNATASELAKQVEKFQIE